jgi:diguanylate cyclase (GGDEF)-like protein
MTESMTTTDASAPLSSGAFLHARTRADEPETAQSWAAIPPGARVLVFLTGLAALVATLAASFLAHPDRNWTTFAVLAVAAATAQLFGVHTTHNQSYHLAIVFLLAGALILPPELVALLCVVQHVPEWLKERYPFEIQGFNIANYTLAALGAFTGAHLVLGSHSAGADSRTALAGLAAGVVFVVANHVVLAGMLRVARGHSLRESGLFTLESLMTDLVLAIVGVGLGAWWNVNTWFLPVSIAPLVLIHRALSIPRLRAEAALDTKTGLYNAGRLNAALEDEMERALRFNRPLSVIVADLDLLRKINNSYGHLAGDAVLLGVANVFRAELRPYDVAARFGGEEFAVVLPETEFEEALAIAERIRHAIEDQPFRRHGSDDPVPATLSLGVSSFPQHAQDSDELVHQADLALYRAKALGRNRVCGATAETRMLKKLIQGTSRGEQSPAEGQPRGFRPYGEERSGKLGARVLARLRATAETVRAQALETLAAAKPAPAASEAERRIRVLIGLLVLGAASLLALNVLDLRHTVLDDPAGVGGFALVVLALQLLSADLYGNGAEGASAIGILAAGFAFGPSTAISLGMLAALAQWVRRHGLFHRGLFDVANFSLSAAAAAYAYRAIAQTSGSVAVHFAGAVAATIAYRGVNSSLLSLVMSLAEGQSVRAIWNERFRWASVHYLAYSPLAFATAVAYNEMGLVGLAAFAVPPALLTISVRQYLAHTRTSVEEVRRANEELRRSNTELAESNQRVRRTHLQTIAALSRSMEAKDVYTGGHTERVAAVAVAVAHKLGYRGDELDAIEIGGLLHDIGKIGIPESMINKAGALNEEEWTKMREHPVISDYILSEVEMHPFVRQIARWSHERIDGQGYPDRLAGNEIPLPARIMLVADAFDALVTDRAYRRRRSIPAALAEIREHAGTQFCPIVVDALERIWREQPHVLSHGAVEPVADVA